MASGLTDPLGALSGVQTELRKLPMSKCDGIFATSSAGENLVTGYLKGVAGAAMRGHTIGCRLFHWNPELEHVRVKAMRNGQLREYKVYFSFDRWTGSRPHVFFDTLYKTKYTATKGTGSGSAAERKFGVTYSGLQSKREVKPILDAFKQCAKEAGTLVASIKDQLASVLPAETLAAKSPVHRWIFTVFDVAWKAPAGSPHAATKYIPIEAFDAFMRTNESLLYDLDCLRSTPWSELERRLDKNGWGYYTHYEETYASWCEELPEYYASRIDDIVQASDWTIDWLVKELQGEA